MKIIAIFLIALFVSNESFSQNTDKAIYKSDAYSIYADSIVQEDKFVAKAVSDYQITSNYISPSKRDVPALIKFKFAINGNVVELKAGVDHHFFAGKDGDETPIIKFGEELKQKSTDKSLLKPDTRLKIRVDLNAVFKELDTKGYFVSQEDDTLYKADFKTVYVGGDTSPMSWNFAALYKIPELEMKDDNHDGIYEAIVNLNPSAIPTWKLKKDISAFPQYKSSFPISNAIYNMSLEEMMNAVEIDSTFRTGEGWPGVWTRDISYSITLSMAYLQPKVAMYSLMKKVNKNGRIIQDTGSGGSYPVSTDRMIWATAAWEVYKATGDKDWLKKIYPIIKNSLQDDIFNIYDGVNELYRGESSFLDWRSQTYPDWVQPIDIYTSLTLGTNAVHYNANKVLVQIATELSQKGDSIKFSSCMNRTKNAINKKLWLDDKGYYGQYLYGKNYMSISPKSEALGEALCVYFGISDDERAKIVVANTPVTKFGIPCIYPQIPDKFAYHNNAVWPFVQSYWALASAKAGNENAVLESISSIYRPAAMFLTNRENYVADDGDYMGTAINSRNMLWSLSGNLSLIHRVIFGIEFKANSLLFHPFVPKAFSDTRTLSNFKYRNCILDIKMIGYGNIITSFKLDGSLITSNEVPSNLTGKHTVEIILNSIDFIRDKIYKVSNDISPQIPNLSFSKGKLKWKAVKSAVNYNILRNGKSIAVTNKLSFDVKKFTTYSEYQIFAIDAKKHQSFASEPLILNNKNVQIIQMGENNISLFNNVKGYTGNGFIEISKTKNTEINLDFKINKKDFYAIDFRYANGSGPIDQENKAAIRTVLIDGRTEDTLVFPQINKDDWTIWGFTNSMKKVLSKGNHKITIVFREPNENMNIDINQALIDYMRIKPLN